MMFRSLWKALLVLTLVSAAPSLERPAAAATHAAQGRKHHRKHRHAQHRARRHPHDRARGR